MSIFFRETHPLIWLARAAAAVGLVYLFSEEIMYGRTLGFLIIGVSILLLGGCPMCWTLHFSRSIYSRVAKSLSQRTQ